MAGKKENDEISKLLDSFEADGALEEKMEGFAAKKRRKDKYTQQINMIDGMIRRRQKLQLRMIP